jgi:hypothetical protein
MKPSKLRFLAGMLASLFLGASSSVRAQGEVVPASQWPRR